MLDQALLRPGRFDRRVAVQPPDRAGREKILEVHTRSVPLGPDVDLGRIAATTPGMVGADLANLVNEAALLAARREPRRRCIEADFTDALERIILGAERQVMMSHEDKRRTAYHEGGHAIVGMLTAGADPVRKISIIPRGISLGVTFSAPDADRFSYERRRAARQDQGRARRPRRRGARLRRADDRRRVRHPAAHRARPADGRPLGDERRRSARSLCFPPTAAARSCRAPPRSRRARRS